MFLLVFIVWEEDLSCPEKEIQFMLNNPTQGKNEYKLLRKLI